jgi:hypothetical protein
MTFRQYASNVQMTACEPREVLPGLTVLPVRPE